MRQGRALRPEPLDGFVKDIMAIDPLAQKWRAFEWHTIGRLGSTGTLSASPNSPYVFTSWTDGPTTNPLPITLSAPESITATFSVPGFTCAITGDATASVADVQFIINEALGLAQPSDDLNRDNIVNVADVQKVIGAALRVRLHLLILQKSN